MFAVYPTVSTARASTIESTVTSAVNAGFTKVVSNAHDVLARACAYTSTPHTGISFCLGIGSRLLWSCSERCVSFCFSIGSCLFACSPLVARLFLQSPRCNFYVAVPAFNAKTHQSGYQSTHHHNCNGYLCFSCTIG